MDYGLNSPIEKFSPVQIKLGGSLIQKGIDFGFPSGGGRLLRGVPDVQVAAGAQEVGSIIRIQTSGESDQHNIPIMRYIEAFHE